jgi:hypothetical protein
MGSRGVRRSGQMVMAEIVVVVQVRAQGTNSHHLLFNHEFSQKKYL